MLANELAQRPCTDLVGMVARTLIRVAPQGSLAADSPRVAPTALSRAFLLRLFAMVRPLAHF